ncbi:trehalose operon repressor [Brachyspira hyodysenteriae]|nr:trehalose operon repressor [Brachyspira hyodysenteriae]MDA0094885.1 trehalose operon repressor [Brachyspira hyodysenteriae]MDA1467605.1 trehalose operon repressor [Brachyspira hyodysenteriae]
MASKYEEIYNSLLDKIRFGYYKKGDILPSEYDLMKEYDASRDTIRKSLQLLSNNGCIQKHKGKGSIVINSNIYNFEFGGIFSFKEVASKMYGKVETIVHRCECIKPDSLVKTALKLNDDDKVWAIERIRNIDGENIILDIDFINASIIPFIDENILKDSLYEHIEKNLQLKISYAEREISCEKINNNDKKLLDLKDYDMIINVESKTFYLIPEFFK